MTKKQPPKKKSPQSQNDTKKSNVSLTRVIFYLTSASAAVLSYFVYVSMIQPPPLPELDLNHWWGEHPIDTYQDTSIQPFKIEFSDVMVNDLKERLLHRRPFTRPLESSGFTYGFNTNYLTRVLDYWQNKYNFREREDYLNKYDHYKTNVQGLDVHFIRVTPKVDAKIAVVPLLLLHGWPGSIREFYEIIPQLTTPRDEFNFVFEIIAPSLPGYGFSEATSQPGLGATDMAVIMYNLMRRLNITHYYVQGGDWGHAIGSNMATLFPESVLGFHTNMPFSLHPVSQVITVLGSFWPSLVVQPELVDRYPSLSEQLFWIMEEFGYMHLQATKPDTVGVALADSPAGLAAYILEKFSTWTNRDYKRSADGNLLDKFSLTHLLDNIMIYWSTNSITTSMRLYAETFNKKEMARNIDKIPTKVPTWVIKFKHELAFQPDCALSWKYHNLLHSTAVQDGGHFAAFELPEILAKDIFAAVEAFKLFHSGNALQKPSDTDGKATLYDFTVKDINGKEVKLDKYKGHVTLIVNVASECGLTDTNYKQLNQLYEKYAKKGLRILAFPCNQFGGQEPGTAEDIIKFTKEKGVKFDLFEKVEVNGEKAHPLFKFLKRAQGGSLGDSIKWNFSKFIVDKNGVPVERLAPTVNPLDLEPYLDKYL